MFVVSTNALSSYQYDSYTTTTTTTTVNPSAPATVQHYHQEAVRSSSPGQTNLIGNSSSRSSSSGILLNRVGGEKPKVMSNQLGFQLDENEVRQKGVYFVKYVEANSPSAMAGLKRR